MHAHCGTNARELRRLRRRRASLALAGRRLHRHARPDHARATAARTLASYGASGAAVPRWPSRAGGSTATLGPTMHTHRGTNARELRRLRRRRASLALAGRRLHRHARPDHAHAPRHERSRATAPPAPPCLAGPGGPAAPPPRSARPCTRTAARTLGSYSARDGGHAPERRRVTRTAGSGPSLQRARRPTESSQSTAPRRTSRRVPCSPSSQTSPASTATMASAHSAGVVRVLGPGRDDDDRAPERRRDERARGRWPARGDAGHVPTTRARASTHRPCAAELGGGATGGSVGHPVAVEAERDPVGSWTVATGPAAGSAAGSTTRSLRSVASS